MRIIILLLLLFSLPAFAEDFCNVKYIKNYDGDTYTFDLGQDVPMLFRTIPMRLYGIDTPELRGKTEQERQKGIEAKCFGENEMKNAKVINLTECTGDKYFRILCKVKYDGKDLTEELLKRGLGYPYFGGKKQSFD